MIQIYAKVVGNTYGIETAEFQYSNDVGYAIKKEYQRMVARGYKILSYTKDKIITSNGLEIYARRVK